MPEIRVIAGTNGSGKSTFTDILSNENSVLFNFNQAEFKALTKYPNFEKEIQEYLKAQLNNSVKHALTNNVDITLVTNFNNMQMKPVNDSIQKAIAAGYSSKMIYFHLNSIEESMIRVKYREAEGGREVPPDRIATNFLEGPENLKNNINYFDSVYIIDNSTNQFSPKLVVEIEKGRIINSELNEANKVEVSKIIDNVIMGRNTGLKF